MERDCFMFLGIANRNICMMQANLYSKSFFVMIQGLLQSFLVRLPMSYIMSIQPNASLTYIGLAAPTATVFGILLCFVYYRIKKDWKN